MNIQFLLEKLYDSEVFEKFKKENEDAYPCGGFFVFDKENWKNPDNKYHLDFYVPSIKKMFSFQLENGVTQISVENKNVEENEIKAPSKILLNYNLEFDKIEDLIRKEMEEKKIDKKIQKFLFSLQNIDGKDFLIGTIFISNFGMIKANIDVSEMKVTDFQKKSFLDFIRKG